MKALILVATSPGASDEVQRRISAIEGVTRALVVTGRADVAVFAEGTLGELRSAMKAVLKTPGVSTTETLLEAT